MSESFRILELLPEFKSVDESVDSAMSNEAARIGLIVGWIKYAKVPLGRAGRAKATLAHPRIVELTDSRKYMVAGVGPKGLPSAVIVGVGVDDHRDVWVCPHPKRWSKFLGVSDDET